MGILDVTLPDGWEWGCVSDAFEVTRKPRGLPIDRDGSAVFIPMEAIPQDGSYSPRYEARQVAALTSGTYFERGDLLVAKITPSFENGKQACVADCPERFGFATTEVIPLRPKGPRNDQRLLFYYLLHPDVREYVAERMEGSTGRQRVPEAVLLGAPLPVIPLEEQTAIADVLELIVRKRLRERRSETKSSHLKHSTMRSLFSGGLRGGSLRHADRGSAPEGWGTVALGSLGRLGNGSTPKRSVEAYWREGTIPWLNSAKMYEREIISSDQFVTEVALKECHLPVVQPGAVLMAITGQGKTLGHCAVVHVPTTVSQHVAYIQVDRSKADPSFVRGYLETQYESLRQVASGGGSTKGALTCSYLRSIPIPLPDVVEQQEIVAVLDAMDRKIELHHRKVAILDELFKALLHKLVTGQIRAADLDMSALADYSPAEIAS